MAKPPPERDILSSTNALSHCYFESSHSYVLSITFTTSPGQRRQRVYIHLVDYMLQVATLQIMFFLVFAMTPITLHHSTDDLSLHKLLPVRPYY